MEDEIYEDLKATFEKTFSALKRDLARVRSGRANVNLLDNIRVSYYGQPTPLSQVASLQVPEPRTITIKPWEKNLLGDVERAIQQSNLGLNPANDGTVIRLSIPPLTGMTMRSVMDIALDREIATLDGTRIIVRVPRAAGAV